MAAATTLSKRPSNGPIPVDKQKQPVTVPDFLAAKTRGVRLTMLRAYDYTMARLLDTAGVDGILVGDSLGMVVQGHEHSISVTLEEVIYHTRCVASADIPVIGHIGLTPQSVHRLGGFRVQRDEEKLMADALATEKAGAFAVVVECVPAE